MTGVEEAFWGDFDRCEKAIRDYANRSRGDLQRCRWLFGVAVAVTGLSFVVFVTLGAPPLVFKVFAFAMLCFWSGGLYADLDILEARLKRAAVFSVRWQQILESRDEREAYSLMVEIREFCR